MSLTDLSYYLRKFFPFVILLGATFIALFVVLWIIITSSSGNPIIAPTPKETITFNTELGKLDKLRLPNNFRLPEGSKIIMDNDEGRPTTATTAANIYFIPPRQTRFGYETKVKTIAKRLGIDTDNFDFTLSETTATYDTDEILLTIDIATFNFDFQYKYVQHPTIFDNVSLPNEGRIIESGREFLRQVGSYPESLSRGRERLTYLRYDSNLNELRPVIRANEGSVVRIDYYKPPLDNYPIVSATDTGGQNQVTMLFKNNNYFILTSNIRLFDFTKDPAGRYPIKTGDQAFQDLQEGRGAIYRAKGDTINIKILKMYFAYFEDSTYQPYLQPVYIFEGADKTFVAYVQAITSDWVADPLYTPPSPTPELSPTP